jgi:hypothetical protein
MFKKFGINVSRSTATRWRKKAKITFIDVQGPTAQQKAYMAQLIRNGNSSRVTAELYEKKFHKKINRSTLQKYAKQFNIKFKGTIEGEYTPLELEILKGLWLVNARKKRMVMELPTRGYKAMGNKILRLQYLNEISNDIREEIREKINSKMSLEKIAKDYKIHVKYIKEFAEKHETSSVEVKDLKKWEDADADKLLDLIEETQRTIRNMESEQNEASIEVHTGDEYIAIAPISDIHLENINTDLRQLREDFAIIKATPNFYMGFGGDMIDNFMVGPHKEGVVEAVLPPAKARLVATKLFETLKGKVLWTILGCHDAWDRDFADYDLPKHIARKLGIPYLGHGGDINLKINETEYFIHARHKYKGGGGNNPVAPCKKILQEIDSKFDIVCVSHHHIAAIHSEHFLGKQRCYIRTGSYKVEDRYSKSIGCRSNEFNIKIPVVILNTKKKEIKVISGVRNAADLLLALNSKSKTVKKRK